MRMHESTPAETRNRLWPEGAEWIYSVLCLLGAVVSIGPTILVIVGFSEWLNRMECPDGPVGSGCYENDLAISLGIFGFVCLPFFIALFLWAILHRRTKFYWWWFGVLCAGPVGTAVWLTAMSFID